MLPPREVIRAYREDAGRDRTDCYAVLEAECDPGGYVPCIIVEGEAGYWTLRGNGPCATPWYWANEQRGLSDEDVARITLTSFAASPRPRDARDAA